MNKPKIRGWTYKGNEIDYKGYAKALEAWGLHLEANVTALQTEVEELKRYKE